MSGVATGGAGAQRVYSRLAGGRHGRGPGRRPRSGDGVGVKVLVLHAQYAEQGGEDAVVASEVALLTAGGHSVETILTSNRGALEAGRWQTLGLLWRAPFDRRIHDRVREICRRVRPDVAHVHNVWFSLSPSVHAACHAEGVATVQTLHNFRLLCVGGSLFRDGRPCETCVGRDLAPGVLHRCYRGSWVLSLLMARMIHRNRSRGTWATDVDAFVALTESSRRLFLRAGLDERLVVVKPNFVEDPGPVSPPGEGALYVGRLSPEKGLDTLLDAWHRVPDATLTVAGDGPCRAALESRAASLGPGRVRFVGRLDRPGCQQALRRSAVVVLPSLWHEGFPRVLVEAFSSGRAVVASRLGALAELVVDGSTGLLFEPGAADELAARAGELCRDRARAGRMGLAARAEYEGLYTPRANLAQLEAIYCHAVERFRRRSGLP
ncbi:MAG: glycosyltransferase family 4 protein [Candidatus Riflebacteria bacterium]|nr:glycosyltransferase family 4 protein [Candidatus Riflebacteria bacterium]